MDEKVALSLSTSDLETTFMELPPSITSLHDFPFIEMKVGKY